MMMYGGMDSDQREAVKAAFQADPETSPVRILLATDAASEGLDLQNHCSRLIHYEIPWNPNRMEQRNGRIDRHGQKAKEVLVYHFVGQGYKEREKSDVIVPVGELAGDLEFLMRAVRKVEAIREDLGKVGPVIAEQVQEAMLGRRVKLDTAKAEKDAEPVRKMLKIERDIQRDIQRLRDQLDATQRELRLSPENIQQVLHVGLQLAGQPALIPTEVERVEDGKTVKIPAYRLPALSGSWALCSEGLAHPHTQEIRPLVFEHRLADEHDDVVLLHLNHRLVAMCLRLLRAEVWSTEGKKRLHRVTARLVPDAVLREPAMIAHARLVVIGGDSHRLHEEIITAGGMLREGRFARINVGQINDALAAQRPIEPSQAMQESLKALYPKHADSLRQALDARMKDRTTGLQKALAERAEKEAGDILAILTELQRSIQEKLNDPENQQLTFEGWEDEERQQLERNMHALRVRVREIPDEIKRETAAVSARFADPQPRMFPVAVTFLVPERMARGIYAGGPTLAGRGACRPRPPRRRRAVEVLVVDAKQPGLFEVGGGHPPPRRQVAVQPVGEDVAERLVDVFLRAVRARRGSGRSRPCAGPSALLYGAGQVLEGRGPAPPLPPPPHKGLSAAGRLDEVVEMPRLQRGVLAVVGEIEELAGHVVAVGLRKRSTARLSMVVAVERPSKPSVRHLGDVRGVGA